jgi:hypothetical protein
MSLTWDVANNQTAKNMANYQILGTKQKEKWKFSSTTVISKGENLKKGNFYIYLHSRVKSQKKLTVY